MKLRIALAFGVALTAITSPVFAQEGTAQAGAEQDAMGFDEIVVTASPRPTNRLDSSVSVSALDAGAIADAAPRTTAEIFRQNQEVSLPVRVEELHQVPGVVRFPQYLYNN